MIQISLTAGCLALRLMYQKLKLLGMPTFLRERRNVK